MDQKIWLLRLGESKPLEYFKKTSEQKLLELESKARRMAKQKNWLENQLLHSDNKAIIFEMTMDFAEKEQYPNLKKLITRTIELFKKERQESMKI